MAPHTSSSAGSRETYLMLEEWPSWLPLTHGVEQEQGDGSDQVQVPYVVGVRHAKNQAATGRSKDHRELFGDTHTIQIRIWMKGVKWHE